MRVHAEQWKFGVAQGAAVWRFWFLSLLYQAKILDLLLNLAILAGLNLRYGFRSQFGIQLVAAVLILPLFDK